MKSVFLHIGTHKTGTTSIQGFLADAGDQLRGRGILYPRAGRGKDWLGQHELRWSLSGKKGIATEQVWDQLHAEIEDFDGSVVVISSEGFQSCSEAEIERVRARFTGHLVHPIVYLRTPFKYLMSTYKQRVKPTSNRFSGDFGRFVREHRSLVDYGALVERWSRVGDVRIRLFDKLHSAGLEASFADAIDVSFDGLGTFVRPPMNVSPSDAAIRFVQGLDALRRVVPGRARGVLTRIRKQALGRRGVGGALASVTGAVYPRPLGTEEAAAWLRRELGAEHERFLKRYIPEDDWKFLKL